MQILNVPQRMSCDLWLGYVLQAFECIRRSKARIPGVLCTVILRFDLHGSMGDQSISHHSLWQVKICV